MYISRPLSCRNIASMTTIRCEDDPHLILHGVCAILGLLFINFAYTMISNSTWWFHATPIWRTFAPRDHIDIVIIRQFSLTSIILVTRHFARTILIHLKSLLFFLEKKIVLFLISPSNKHLFSTPHLNYYITEHLLFALLSVMLCILV